MRLLRLDIDNFMALKAVSITPTGNVLQITGKNGQGKSAVINALFAALLGKKAIPSDPVRHGAEEARIRLDLGEVIVKLAIDRDGDSALIIESEKGARFPAPQTMLKKLFDVAAFDPSAFVRATPREQREALARIMGLSEMLAELAAAHTVDFENRTGINRRVKEFQAQVDAFQWDGVTVNPVDVASVVAEIRAIKAHNEQARERNQLRARTLADIEAKEALIGQKRAHAERLLDESDAIEREVVVLRGQAPLAVALRDDAELQQQMIDAQSINERARRIDERTTLIEKLHAARREADTLTARIEAREAEKQSVIAAAPAPIPGIGFSDDGVTLDGVPFSQASTAQQGLVAAAIGMAGNPELRIMVIRDASLYDESSMAKLEAIAEERDYLVLAERVRDDDSVGIVISAGEVVKINLPVAA